MPNETNIEVVKEPDFHNDKYVAAKLKDPSVSYNFVNLTLSNALLTNQEKIEELRKGTHVMYLTLIESFLELELYIREIEGLDEEHETKDVKQKFISKVYNLYKNIENIMSYEDFGVRAALIKICILILKEYKDTLTEKNMFKFGSLFPDEERYHQFLYSIVTLKRFIRAEEDNKMSLVTEYIDFNKKDFQHGKVFEEYFTSEML